MLCKILSFIRISSTKLNVNMEKKYKAIHFAKGTVVATNWGYKSTFNISFCVGYILRRDSDSKHGDSNPSRRDIGVSCMFFVIK